MNKAALAFSLAVSVMSSISVTPALAQEMPHSHEHGATSSGSADKKQEAGDTGRESSQPSGLHAGMDMKAMCDKHWQAMADRPIARR